MLMFKAEKSRQMHFDSDCIHKSYSESDEYLIMHFGVSEAFRWRLAPVTVETESQGILSRPLSVSTNTCYLTG